MQIIPAIADHLTSVVKGGNWTAVDLSGTLKDINHKEATKPTPASSNTIAALVHHLSYWNRVMIQRIHGTRVSIPDHNGFNVPGINDDTTWKALTDDLLLSTEELAAAILAIDETRLEQPILEGYPSVYKSIQGTVEHIHYHLGQIVVIKHLVKTA